MLIVPKGSQISDILLHCRENFSNEVKGDSKVSFISTSDVDILKNKEFQEVWKVETGLYDEVNSNWLIEDITLFIAFKKDFPNTVPKIYIDKNDISKVGIIPHITLSNCDICVYDNFVITDITNPTGIILETYYKAKNVLIEGITGKNNKDFEDEFTAYWTCENKIKDKKRYYSIVKEFPKNSNLLGVIIYSNYDKNFLSYIFFNKEEKISEKYEEYFKLNRIKYIIKDVFYIGASDLINNPPFEFSYLESLKYIPKCIFNDFRKYYNQKDSEKIVLFSKSIKDYSVLLGWRYFKKSAVFKGFRQKKLTDFNISFSKGLPDHIKTITKFNIDDLNEERLIKRTSTDNVVIPKYKFLIAGLGSVGSNLIYYLNNINFPDFTLIDTDSLQSENIGRHLLGFDYLNHYKVDGIKKHILDKYPNQNIEIFNKSFLDLYNENQSLYNEQDYIFLCTGNMNFEHLLINELNNKKINKPIFILWVEPFLLGGQCLYISPNSPVNIKGLYEDVFKYKYSVIQHSEYDEKRDLFIQREIGCQSTFSPYSSSHLTMFLSSVFIEIFKIIENNDKNGKAITWFGDINFAKKLGIKVNVNFQNYQLNTIHL